MILLHLCTLQPAPPTVVEVFILSEATFYVWKKRYGHLGLDEVRRVRQLEDENAPLKRLIADLTLDKHMLGEALRPAGAASTVQYYLGRIRPRVRIAMPIMMLVPTAARIVRFRLARWLCPFILRASLTCA